jgi:hypothetical protein
MLGIRNGLEKLLFEIKFNNKKSKCKLLVILNFRNIKNMCH